MPYNEVGEFIPPLPARRRALLVKLLRPSLGAMDAKRLAMSPQLEDLIDIARSKDFSKGMSILRVEPAGWTSLDTGMGRKKDRRGLLAKNLFDFWVETLGTEPRLWADENSASPFMLTYAWLVDSALQTHAPVRPSRSLWRIRRWAQGDLRRIRPLLRHRANHPLQTK